MKRIVLRPNENTYSSACQFMKDSLGFESIELFDGTGKSIKSGKEHLSEGVHSISGLLKNRSRLKHAEVVIAIGNASNILLLLMNKLHIIRPKAILWWAFFIHSKKAQTTMSKILKLLNSRNVHFVVFSECEVEMYQKTLGLSKELMIYIPYGDWGNTPIDFEDETVTGDFFFGGGYSNRDYRSLLNGWVKNLPQEKLVLIGSKNNADLVEFNDHYTGDKIRILFDTPSEVFDDYLTRSKACILPFKENTGASGQSVMLRCMRLNKLVISTDTDIMKEYVDQNSAILIHNYDDDLVDAVEKINSNPEGCVDMLKKQRHLYLTKFSYQTITRRLKQIVETV